MSITGAATTDSSQHRRREDSAHEKALREQKNVSRILQDISAAEDTAKKAVRILLRLC